MTPQDAGSVLMTTLDLLALLAGCALFWFDFTRPCPMCKVIAEGEECWYCGAVKEGV